MGSRMTRFFVIFGFIQLFDFQNIEAETSQEKGFNQSTLEKNTNSEFGDLLPSSWPEQLSLASRSSERVRDSESLGRAEKTRQKNQKYKYWYILPLGIPQYAEGYRTMGSAFAAAQVTSLVLYYDRLQKIESGNKTAANLARNTSQAQGASNPLLMPLLDQNEKDVRDAQKEARYSLYAFLGLYGFSVYEALYDPFSTRKIALMRKQQRQIEKQHERNPEHTKLKEDDLDRRDEEAEALIPRRERRSRLGFMIMPQEASAKLSMALSWQTEVP